jgi:DNA-binding GntR family transcriptional regulator
MLYASLMGAQMTGPQRRGGLIVGELIWTAGRVSLQANQQLSHKVASFIRENIMVGRFEAGQYLRTESIAEQMGVSHTPVREALMLLQSEGTVRWEPRRGFRVAAVTDQDVHDLFQVQAFIAGELAARAADTLDEAAVQRLRQLQDQLEHAAESGDAAAVDAYNHEIHRRINKASPSNRLGTLLNQTIQYVPLGFFGTIEGWADASTHDHSAIFDAIEAGDGEAARSAMSAHIVHIGELLQTHLRTHRAARAPA